MRKVYLPLFFICGVVGSYSVMSAAALVPVQPLKNAYQAYLKRDPTSLESLSQKLVDQDHFAEQGRYFIAEANLLRGENNLKAKNWDKAIGDARTARWKFLEIELHYPATALDDEILKGVYHSDLMIADAFLQKKSLEASKRYYEKAFSRIPSKALLITVPFSSIKNYSAGCKKFFEPVCSAWIKVFLSKYPDASPERKFLASEFRALEKEASPQSYPSRFSRYSSPDRDDETLSKAISSYLDRSFVEGCTGFEDFLRDYPKSRQIYRALYWHSECLRNRGEEKDSIDVKIRVARESPLSFYGTLAAYDLGQPIERFIDARLPDLITRDPSLRAKEVIQLERAETFLKAELRELAYKELRDIQPRSTMPDGLLTYLSELNANAGNHLNSFIFMSEYFERESKDKLYSSRHIALVFPVEEFDLIQKKADEASIDPILALSLIKQESAFRAQAVSGSGAVGLMQLMPFTALDVNPSIFQNSVGDTDVNLTLGTKYLSRVIQKFDGNIAVALAGYNAGPTRAQRWYNTAQEKEWSLPEFIESIPYNETRGYVSSILRNYYWYLQRVKGEHLASFDQFYRATR